jgi:hypothetical protein
MRMAPRKGAAAPGRRRLRLARLTAGVVAACIALAAPVAVADLPPLTINLPGDITVEATSNGGATVNFPVTASDPLATITCNPASGSVFAIQTTTVNCSATDTIPTTVSGSFSVTVRDTTPPAVSVPGDMTLEATSASGRDVTFSASASDVVDGGGLSAPCTPSSGSTFGLGQTTVTCSATDTHSNTGTASFKVNIVDNTPPVLSLPGNQSASTSNPGGTSVSFSASANDNIAGSVPVSCSPSSGSTFPIGTTTVNCSANDGHGNTAGGSFSVTVTLTDNTPPVVTVPADITREATSGAGAAVSFSSSAQDNLDGSLPTTCSPSSGSTFPLGATTVTCHATDTHGNTGTDTFKITIRDTTDPTVTAPADITREAASSAGVTVTFSASASDAVDGGLSATCSPASGSTFGLGSTTVTCHATDTHGNTGSDSFTVKVVDTTAPTLHLPADFAKTTTTPAGAATTFTATATDAVDGTFSAVCAPASGATFPVGTTTVNCHATDAHGNTSNGSFSVTVTLTDTTPPVVTVPADITREAASGGGTVVTFSSSALDNLDGPLPTTCAPASGATFPLGATTVACHATDAHSNTGTDTFKITIRDTTNPTVTAPADITHEADSPAGAAVTFTASATDTVDGSLSATCSPASGSTFALGSTTVTCHATDAHGNTGNGSFTVKVVDTTAPIVSVPADLTREANGPGGALVTFTASATDSVDGPLAPAAIVCQPASGSLFPLGKTTVTCNASDIGGNAGHASFAVTVVDKTAPRLNVPEAITMTSLTSLPASDSTIAAFLSAANASDLVDGKVLVTNDAPASFPIGTTTITFAAIDKSGNKTVESSSVTLTIVTVPPPVVTDAKPPSPVSKLTARGSNGTVTLTWAPPGDADFDHVVVEQSAAGSPLAAVYTGTASTYTARGLKNGVEYRFVVVSYDKKGNASAESAVVATPAAAMLVLPKDGAVTKKPPTLTWRSVSGASYYNVQLYRLPSLQTTNRLVSGLKILSLWPTTLSVRLATKWTFSKKTYRLSPGLYRWYVWPGFGPRADVKYGPALGQSTFVVRGR